MCVLSMVHDHFNPLFPSAPIDWTPSPQETLDIQRLLRDFKDASEAAKKVDALTGQPDCVDPEKAKLIERVERLEKMIDVLLSERKGTSP